jgi:hypothetical protein
MTWNSEIAVRVFYCKLFNEGLNPTILHKNKFHHTLIGSKNKNYYLLYKKDFFNSFSQIFKEYANTEYAGVGETINREYMQFALNHNAELIFCYEKSPCIYYCADSIKLSKEINRHLGTDSNYSEVLGTKLLKLYCEFHNLVRVQDKTNEYKIDNYSESKIQVNEQTYSFPVKILKRF